MKKLTLVFTLLTVALFAFSTLSLRAEEPKKGVCECMKALNLTPEQVKKVEALHATHMKACEAMKAKWEKLHAEFKAEKEALQKAHKEEMMKILTPEQQAKMKEHKCEKGAEGMKGHEGCKGDKAKMGEQKSGSGGHEGIRAMRAVRTARPRLKRRRPAVPRKRSLRKKSIAAPVKREKPKPIRSKGF